MTILEKMAYERQLWDQFLATGGDPRVATKEWFE
jgi:hypothetical protein